MPVTAVESQNRKTITMIDQKKIIGTIGVPQTFAQCLGRIDHLGSNRRLTFVTASRDEQGYYEANAVIVISVEALLELAQAAAADRTLPAEFVTMPAHQRAN